MQPFKLTLLTKSSQSMCKYRLFNLDLQRSLHVEKGAVSRSKQACPLKGLSIFQNILSSQCNGQLHPFCDTPKVSSVSLKASPCYLCCFSTCLDSRLSSLSSKGYFLAAAIALDASGNTGNKLVQAETTLPSSEYNINVGEELKDKILEFGLNRPILGHTVNNC